MNTSLLIYGIFLFLSVFNAGNMTTLQIQHYGIYPFVGTENFKRYIQANNKAALIPSILPGILLLLVSIVLLFYRPEFMSLTQAIFCVALNIVAFISTIFWQRKIQGEMAITGYDDVKAKLLVSTNWVRTISFLILAFMATYIILKAVRF